MSDPRLAVAAGSALAGDAAAQIARAGGNAVDACLTSAVMAWVAEPFMSSLGGSGFIALRAPDRTIEIVDGNNSMPLAVPEEPGRGIRRLYLENYSNGMYTGIGGGSVAVPGILAAIRVAWERHGCIEWPALFAPAIKAAEKGIAFPRTSAYYLSATFEEIWSAFPDTKELLTLDGRPLQEGETFVQAELAGCLREIADGGPEVFYGGEIGRLVIDAIAEDDGLLSMDDLVSYEAKPREPLNTTAFGWRIHTNPPPAVGGAVLAHMLALLEEADLSDPVERLRALVGAEAAAIGHRNQHYEDPGEIAHGLEDALLRIRSRGSGPASTTHMSTADSEGYACALTQSSGYGSGMFVQGILLNNTLGEEELNPQGVHGLPPGSRTHSNMTPTIAGGDDRIVALGSPGADRIVGAVAQTLIALAADGKSLADAIAAPRAHLAMRPDGELLCYEAGLPGEEIEYRTRFYEEPHMFFGAVQAASVDASGRVDATHDPRRSGSTVIV